MAQAGEPVRLEPSQIAAARAVGARAFHDDPMFVYTHPNLAKREKAINWWVGAVIRYGQLYGEVYVKE